MTNSLSYHGKYIEFTLYQQEKCKIVVACLKQCLVHQMLHYDYARKCIFTLINRSLMKEFWDKRYSEEGFAYGEQPNMFFKNQLDKIDPGRILLPADGEGRNGVYAATQGWDVNAFDISSSGKQKADELAKTQGVKIDFEVGTLEEMNYAPESFDVIALIFAHFPLTIKETYHKEFLKLLKPGGIIIFEAFSKDHLEYNAKDPKVGGPKNIDLLYSAEELEDYFDILEAQMIIKTETELSEGEYHKGVGSVLRYIGKKAQ
jgi:SAM-dependent methyltransferase